MGPDGLLDWIIGPYQELSRRGLMYLIVIAFVIIFKIGIKGPKKNGEDN